MSLPDQACLQLSSSHRARALSPVTSLPSHPKTLPFPSGTPASLLSLLFSKHPEQALGLAALFAQTAPSSHTHFPTIAQMTPHQRDFPDGPI
jgi:hypothetical protein